MTLEFNFWMSKTDRDESEADACFQRALLECSDRAKHFTKMRTKIWHIGRTNLDIVPTDEGLSLQIPSSVLDQFVYILPSIRLPARGALMSGPPPHR